MLDWLVRMWRVEVALWVCYWRAMERGDRYSYRYCADHSLLVTLFWIAVILLPVLVFGF
jgi:hypothetical protein